MIALVLGRWVVCLQLAGARRAVQLPKPSSFIIESKKGIAIFFKEIEGQVCVLFKDMNMNAKGRSKENIKSS